MFPKERTQKRNPQVQKKKNAMEELASDHKDRLCKWKKIVQLSNFENGNFKFRSFIENKTIFRWPVHSKCIHEFMHHTPPDHKRRGAFCQPQRAPPNGNQLLVFEIGLWTDLLSKVNWNIHQDEQRVKKGEMRTYQEFPLKIYHGFKFELEHNNFHV